MGKKNNYFMGVMSYLKGKNYQVDFVVIKDSKPWFLVEVKNSDKTISPSLSFFQEQIKAPFAFQVILEMDYVLNIIMIFLKLLSFYM